MPEMQRLSFTLPLPPPECSPNYHGHWRGRHKATKAYRELARLSWLGLVKGWTPCKVRISAVFYCGPTVERRYRPLDISNAEGSLKAVIDGFVDGGMTPTDSYKWVTWGDVEIKRIKREHEGKAHVEVTVERLDP